MSWYDADFARGYRAHLPHPYSTLQGDSGCLVCGGHSDRRIHDEPHQRITEEEWLAEHLREAIRQELQRPQFTDTRPIARLRRLDTLRKRPAVSNPHRGEAENRPEVVRFPEPIDAGGPMLNEKELAALRGIMHYLNSDEHAELTFDVNVVDSSGDVLGSLQFTDQGEYQFYPGMRIS